MTLDAPTRPTVAPGPRFTVSRGMVTITIATVLLFIACALVAPTSISRVGGEAVSAGGVERFCSVMIFSYESCGEAGQLVEPEMSA